MSESEHPEHAGPQNISKHPVENPVENPVGSEVGGYTIVEVIGRGSTGVVYRATDAAGNVVAIKQIDASSDPALLDIFRREAATLASFDHPCALRFIEVIDSPTTPAVVTEFVSGGSLREHLANHGPFSSAEVVTLLSPIAEALSAAHRTGLTHGDVKPSNILRRADGGCVLADFGTAAYHPDAKTPGQSVLASATYLDPEILTGATPSAKSDTYSLGIVAYELLTGYPPFRGDTTQAVLDEAANGTFDPLDRNTFGSFANEVERSFARDSTDRFETADDLLAAWNWSTAHPEAPDEGPSATTTFAVNTRPAALVNAEPVQVGRNWKRIGVAVAAVAAIGATAGGIVLKRANNQAAEVNGVVPFKVYCDPAVTAQCVESVVRTPDGMSITFKGDGQPTRFAVGKRTDALRVSNFFCGPNETLALYRPTTGTIYYFREWPLPGKKTEIRADATGVFNAAVVVSDYDNNGCGDIGLERGNERVWFLPSQQQARLRLIAPGDTL